MRSLGRSIQLDNPTIKIVHPILVLVSTILRRRQKFPLEPIAVASFSEGDWFQKNTQCESQP